MTPSLRLQAMRALAIEQLAARAVAELRGAGVESILLKGPSLARALYEPGEIRASGDVDLLVPSETIPRAQRALEECGFQGPSREILREDFGHHAITLERREDDMFIDLHWTLPTADAPPERVWDELFARSELLALAGGTVRVLAGPALAMHVALHAAHHGAAVSRPLHDLARAVPHFELATWRHASELAERIGARDAFVAGLQLDPEGRAVAHELGHEGPLTVRAVLRATTPPTTALSWERALGAPTAGEKLRLLARGLLRPQVDIRTWGKAMGRANAPRPILYGWRVASVIRRSIPALVALHRARRQQQRASDGVNVDP